MNPRLVIVKDRLVKIAPKVGYPLFYLFCLLLFFSWTFPYGRLKERIIASFNASESASGSPQEMEIDDVTSSFVTGIKLEGIRITTPATDPTKVASELKIDSVVARISLLGMLVGNRDVSFHVKAFGGSIDGAYDETGKENDVDVDLDGVNVGQIAPLVNAIGLPVEGTLNGTVSLIMPEGKASKANGTMALEFRDLAVGDGKAKLKGALALPRVNIGALTVAGDAKDGALTLKKLAASGKDIDLQGDGKVQLRELAMESLLDVNVRFKINDAYRTKSDVTKSLFGAPGSTAPALFELADPKIKQSKRPDGFYAWHARGQLGRLDFAPAGGAAAGTPFQGLGPARNLE